MTDKRREIIGHWIDAIHAQNGVGTGGTANLLIRLGLRIFLQNAGLKEEKLSLMVCDINSEKERLQVNFFDLEHIVSCQIPKGRF